MTDKFTALTPELHRYVVEHGARRDDVLRAVEEETAALGDIALMQTSPDEGALLTLLTQLVDARLAVEVGTFTGYGAICIARGLAPGGRLLCCELDEGWAGTARANLERAGVADRVEVRVGPALDTLRSLPSERTIDLSYVDADKSGYPEYYEELLARTRPGGLIVLDNTILGGRVLAPEDDSARAIAALNARIAADERVDVAMLAVADGVTLARVR